MPLSSDHSYVSSRPEAGLRFAHISDTHVECAHDALIITAACRAAERLSVDLIVFGGDTANHGSDQAYQAVLQALAGTDTPVLHVIGNHDLLGGKDLFGRLLGPPCWRLDLGGYTLLGLDSTGRSELTWGGVFGGPAIGWLERELMATPPDRPIVLFTHHGVWSTEPHEPRRNLLWDVLNWRPVHDLFAGRRLVLACAGHAHENARQQWGETTLLWTAALSTVRENHLGLPAGFNVVTVSEEGVEVGWVPVAG